MSLASGLRPCFCLLTKASCLAPGFVCLSLPPWFLPVTAPLDHRVLDLSPSAIRLLAAACSAPTSRPVRRSPGLHPAKEPILIPPPYTDSVK
ncbi:hypothetical protein ATANTOWER_015089 [Ataeniobius toweri]|uniref:Secreted protein n=1 Tax=Ataeniobius toweri TaxID=208326 RepID=A0ABU7ACA9_9TELE|nr:hypothetical protein [Ataeniobius toweri]